MMKLVAFLPILSFFILGSLPQLSQAYIPRSKTIIKKMTRNNGRRAYKIQREVVLQNSGTNLKAKETWLVKNGDTMKLTVESTDPQYPWSFVILYSGGKRRTVSTEKKIKSYAPSSEFFEPLFHDRFYKSMTSRLVGFQFVPDWVKKIEDPDYVEGETKMTAEPFIRLEPLNGSVNYAIGARKNENGDPWQTTLWVEQDSFVIKKGRLGSKSEFTNNDFQTFSGGLKLPKEQVISWGENVARVKLLTAEQFTPGRKTKLWTLPKKKLAAAQIPSEPIVKEFYSRFR